MDFQFWNPGKVWIGKTRLWVGSGTKTEKKERKKGKTNLVVLKYQTQNL